MTLLEDLEAIAEEMAPRLPYRTEQTRARYERALRIRAHANRLRTILIEAKEGMENGPSANSRSGWEFVVEILGAINGGRLDASPLTPPGEPMPNQQDVRRLMDNQGIPGEPTCKTCRDTGKIRVSDWPKAGDPISLHPCPDCPASPEVPRCTKCEGGYVTTSDPRYRGFYYCDCPAGLALHGPHCSCTKHSPAQPGGPR